MTDLDKYSIRASIEKTLSATNEVPYLFESRPDKIVSTIWEDVYVNMPLCDPEDPTIVTVIEHLKKRCGTIKVEVSCGLFSVIRLILPNNICYLQKCQGGYYILPMYKNVRRFPTRLEPEMAADLILEFDRFAPVILKSIEDKVLERKQKALTSNLIKATTLGVIKTLKDQGVIKVPDEVVVSGTTPECINICFQSHKVIRCKLENLEQELIERFGNR